MKRYFSISLFLAVSIILLTLPCCERKSERGPLFERIDALCDSNPERAMAILDNMRYDALPEKDRHRYDLLSIKIRDKAYIRHTSDSLILDVIDYYSKQEKSGLYPEALYYGGRVYSDIGDLPTALEYFHMAIDATPDTRKSQRFKSSLLSQTGRLYEELRLYGQGSHLIRQAIDISIQLNDSVNVYFDNMQLITQYINTDSLTLARECLIEATEYSKYVSDTDKKLLQIKNAQLLLHEGKIDSALTVIRPIIHLKDPICRNYALKVAGDIYKEAGISDSAYMYAKELAMSNNFNNRLYGFNILFSPEINSLIPLDSMPFFVLKYSEHMRDYRDRYESQGALLQNSKYNYSLHEMRRKKAEQERRILTIAVVLLAVLSVIAVMYFKQRNAIAEMKLRMAIQLARHIACVHSPSMLCNHDAHNPNTDKIVPLAITSRKQQLKNELLNNLRSICSQNDRDPIAEEILSATPTVEKLNQMVRFSNGISESNKKLWNDVEEAIQCSSPEFRSRLQTLTMDKMTEKEYHVAMLIRCGIAPKDIATLLNKTKSTITDRRTSLAKKIFGPAARNTDLDSLIMSL